MNTRIQQFRQQQGMNWLSISLDSLASARMCLADSRSTYTPKHEINFGMT